MMRRAAFIAFGSCCISFALIGMAFGQEGIKPRDPLFPGWRNLEAMLPPSNESPVDVDAVRIANLGNVTLSLSYWDAEGNWRTVSLASGQTTNVSCPKCGPTITVAYHNGKEGKTFSAEAGKSYVLNWSSDQKEWQFKLSPRQPSLWVPGRGS